MIDEKLKRKIVESAFEDAKNLSGMNPELRENAEKFGEYIKSEEFFYADIDSETRSKIYRLYSGLSRYIQSLEIYSNKVTEIAIDLGINGVEKSSEFLKILLTNKFNKKES